MSLDWLPHITMVSDSNNPRATAVSTRTATDNTMNPIPASRYVLDGDEKKKEEKAVTGEGK